MPADVPTRVVYKAYNQSGSYIGNLPQPTTPLKIVQDINSLGSQMTITFPVSADVSRTSSDTYTTEDGSSNYTDESGAINYTTGNQAPIVSPALQSVDTPIKNGNTVQIWLYNYWYPNGKCMFIGRIRQWDADFGGDGTTHDGINVVLYSTGYDMDNYLVTGDFYLLDQQQTTYEGIDDGLTFWETGSGNRRYGQTITSGPTITNLSKITLHIGAGISQNATLNLYHSPSDASAGINVLATIVVPIVGTGDPGTFAFADYDFIFTSPISIPPSTQYFVTIQAGATSSAGLPLALSEKGTDPYPTGQMWRSVSGAAYDTATTGAYDVYFKTYATVRNTTTTFTDCDPTTQMLKPIIDDYNSRGGSQEYNSGTVDATGLSLTYTFKVQTIYEALQAILNLSPDGFYYYVDLGTQLIYFKNQSITPDFIFTKGIEINALRIVSTTEGSINDLFFTGGDIGGGVNLYKEYTDSPSINAFGPLLDRKTDGRVIIDETANAIGESEIVTKSGEQSQTVIVIPHTTKLDTTQLVPGKTVGFRGYGSFVDTLVLQIAHREWSPDSVSLTVGVLPKRLTYAYENTTRQLIASQTQANPMTPS